MTPRRPLIALGLRVLALTLVAAASLQLSLHIAETIFLTRQGVGGVARLTLLLGSVGAVVVGTWLYNRSQAIADRI